MNQEYTQRLLNIETELRRWLPVQPDANWIRQIFGEAGQNAGAETISLLLKPLRELLSRGGKRWRPLLMTLVCETLCGGDAALPLSPLVEFSHNASLIHDDIEDESDERRGKPAVHKLFGIDAAINSGSFFYFLASCCINTYAQNKRAAPFTGREVIYKLWLECMSRLHLGQAMDINWHRNISIVPQIDDYYFMCRLKTGSLARLAAVLGAFTAGVQPEAAGILGEAADLTGVGFQILDDVKNLTTGNPGKKRGDDIVEGKKSLPLLIFMHKFPERRERLFYCLHAARHEGCESPEAEELIGALAESGAIKEAEETGVSLLKKARGIFDSKELARLKQNENFAVKENSRVLLDGLIDFIS